MCFIFFIAYFFLQMLHHTMVVVILLCCWILYYLFLFIDLCLFFIFIFVVYAFSLIVYLLFGDLFMFCPILFDCSITEFSNVCMHFFFLCHFLKRMIYRAQKYNSGKTFCLSVAPYSFFTPWLMVFFSRI